MSKWYGKIIFSREGIVTLIETENREVAQAFVDGFYRAKELTSSEDEDPLEEYFAVVDQLEPIDE